MSYMPRMISVDSFTAYVGGKPYTAKSDHPNWTSLRDALNNNDEKKFLQLIDIPKSVKQYTKGKVEVVDGEVVYNGKAIHSKFAEHILWTMNQKFDYMPLLRCFEKTMANPSMRAKNEFFEWFTKHGLVVTEDGDVLGHKQVRPDYKDWNSNSVDNSIGTTVPPMDRNEVNDDWGKACAEGYHVGSLEYVSQFHAGQGHCIVVKFSPTDVVCCPSNENKLRCTVYTVVSEMDTPVAFASQLYTNDGVPWAQVQNEEGDWVSSEPDYDEDYNDEVEEWEEDEFTEDDEEDDFCPKFERGDKLVSVGTDSPIYTANYDSYLNESGEEVVSITWDNFTDVYPVDNFDLVC